MPLVPRLLLFCASLATAETRSLRLVDGEWRNGSQKLDPGFFDPRTKARQSKLGVGHVGRTASVVLLPEAPVGVTFEVDPGNLFPGRRLTIDLPGGGKVFLDKAKYESFHTVIRGVPVEIDAEADNPARQAALETMDLYARLFPARASVMTRSQVTIVLLRNTTEGFQKEPIRPNGQHSSDHLWSLLFSQEGTGVLDHSFHEIGGLFRIPQTNHYSQGLTWAIAFDLMEKLAKTPQDQKNRQCGDIQGVIGNIRNTAAQNGGDLSHSIEYYVGDALGRNGWPMYAWGSAYYWKKVNAAMEAQHTPTVYDLINDIHRQGLEGLPGEQDLDKLTAAYGRLSSQSRFTALANHYFREETLAQLLSEARSELSASTCPKP